LTKSDKKIPLAKIGRSRGLKGQLRIEIYNPDSDLFVKGKTFHVSPVKQFPTLTIASCDGQWCTFEEIQNPEDAKILTHAELCLDRSELPAPKKGSYYHVDLIGCLIVDQETKKTVGALNDILYTASNDVWVVISEKNEEHLIPILKGVIEKIDLDDNKIYLNIPEMV
jgi:16S rRNA processing protein RimM